MSCRDCVLIKRVVIEKGYKYITVLLRHATRERVCKVKKGDIESLDVGTLVIVEKEDGLDEFAKVLKKRSPVFKPCQLTNAVKFKRVVSDEDLLLYDNIRDFENRARSIMKELISLLELEMNLVKIVSNVEMKTVRVYFTAPQRVDFRELVKLAVKKLKARVHMQHIGARDATKIVEGMGVCGRRTCCSSWLDDFQSVSMNMVKAQLLVSSSSKITGKCGKLLCCLAYEYNNYV